MHPDPIKYWEYRELSRQCVIAANEIFDVVDLILFHEGFEEFEPTMREKLEKLANTIIYDYSVKLSNKHHFLKKKHKMHKWVMRHHSGMYHGNNGL